MKKLLLLSLLLSTAIPAWAEMENCKEWESNWVECKIDADCVVIPNPCGWPTSAANKTFSDKASQCNIHAGAAMSCATWTEMSGEERFAKCENNKCINVSSLK